MKRSIIWMYGGGVQTIAILTLIAEGRLPKPELAIMANTSRERSSTWRYTDTYARPILADLGIPLEIAGHELAAIDLYDKNQHLIIPVFTLDNGKLPTHCSDKWKKRVANKRLRELGYGPKKPIVAWLGMSLDEIERLKDSGLEWVKNHWPLVIDIPLRRHECLLQIERFGLPEPPKSACWMCPHLDNEEWQDIKLNDPEDFKRAVEFDYTIRANDRQGGVYLHRDTLPLDQADLTVKQKPMPLLECANSCWT